MFVTSWFSTGKHELSTHQDMLDNKDSDLHETGGRPSVESSHVIYTSWSVILPLWCFQTNELHPGNIHPELKRSIARSIVQWRFWHKGSKPSSSARWYSLFCRETNWRWNKWSQRNSEGRVFLVTSWWQDTSAGRSRPVVFPLTSRFRGVGLWVCYIMLFPSPHIKKLLKKRDININIMILFGHMVATKMKSSKNNISWFFALFRLDVWLNVESLDLTLRLPAARRSLCSNICLT